MIELIEDKNWNSQLAPKALPQGFKNIDNYLTKYGLIAYSKGNTYIYLFASNIWAVLANREAQIQICDIVGCNNVSTNYFIATIPYINHLNKNAKKTNSIPTSICIGTRRLNIFTKGNNIHLRKCTDIVLTDLVINKDGSSKGLDKRIGGFCIMPCLFTEIPRSWYPGGEERISTFLSILFIDPLEFETVKWLIGNAIVDPNNTSKFILLYGPGGTGKSTIIQTIESLLRGCCSTIKGSSLTSKYEIDIDTASLLASSRMLTAGDINLEGEKLNLHTVKQMTGHDSVAIPPISVSTSCSVVAACNNLPDPIDQGSWVSTAISRRMVVVFMNVNSTNIPNNERPDTDEDCLDFLMSCVYTKCTMPAMPISTRCLLYTLLGDKYNKLEHIIEITTDLTEQDILDANNYLEIYLIIGTNMLGECASLISSNVVIIIANTPYVNNIKIRYDVINTTVSL